MPAPAPASIVGAAFMKLTDTKLLEVPYRGSAAAFPDLLGGRVDLFFDSTPAALPYVKSGQAKGIGILTAKRNPQIPDVPTMTESGVGGLEIDSWIGLFAPAKTPPAVLPACSRRSPRRFRSSSRGSKAMAASSWTCRRGSSKVSSRPSTTSGSRSSRTREIRLD